MSSVQLQFLTTKPTDTPKLPAAGLRRVLLVGSSVARRDLRASVMHKLGITVDCAQDLTEARHLWRPKYYHLVLIDAGEDDLGAALFQAAIKSANPRQRVAFLVGRPAYLAANFQGKCASEEESAHGVPQERFQSLLRNASDAIPPYSRFAEAVLRMNAQRSLRLTSRGKAGSGVAFPNSLPQA